MRGLVERHAPHVLLLAMLHAEHLPGETPQQRRARLDAAADITADIAADLAGDPPLGEVA